MATVTVTLQYEIPDDDVFSAHSMAMTAHEAYRQLYPAARVMVMIASDRCSAWWPPVQRADVKPQTTAPPQLPSLDDGGLEI